jgi:hypothetical protein
MSYKFLRYDAGNIRTIAASNSHTNSSIYKGTGISYFRQYKNGIPKLALEIQDLSLLATVLLPRLDDIHRTISMFILNKTYLETAQTTLA